MPGCWVERTGASVSAAAVALALGAAVLHAGWNLVVKDGPDRLLALWAIIVVASLPCVAVLVVLGPPPATIAPLVVTSAILHVGYDGAMAAVYGRSDLGVAYPLVRGGAVGMSAVGGIVLLGDAVSLPISIGIALTLLGAVLLGSDRADPATVAMSAAAAAVLAAFTLLDSAGSRQLESSLWFVSVMFPTHAALMTLFVLSRRRPAQLAGFLRANPRRVLVTGIAAPASYVLVLAATRLAPVGAVTALRESSVLMAALLGVVVLQERPSRRAWAALAAIALGAGLVAAN